MSLHGDIVPFDGRHCKTDGKYVEAKLCLICQWPLGPQPFKATTHAPYSARTGGFSADLGEKAQHGCQSSFLCDAKSLSKVSPVKIVNLPRRRWWRGGRRWVEIPSDYHIRLRDWQSHRICSRAPLLCRFDAEELLDPHGSITGASAKARRKFLLKEIRKCSVKGMHTRASLSLSRHLKSISPALINTELLLLLLMKVFVQCSVSCSLVGV